MKIDVNPGQSFNLWIGETLNLLWTIPHNHGITGVTGQLEFQLTVIGSEHLRIDTENVKVIGIGSHSKADDLERLKIALIGLSKKEVDDIYRFLHNSLDCRM